MVFRGHQIPIFFVTILFTCYNSNGLSLDEFGHYKIVVAIDERTVQNSVTNYTENIKMGIQDLSNLLYHTTNGKFSIIDADILLPDHWDVEIDGVATTQFYEGADLKISHTFSVPYVDNPNTCGYPGRDMRLPYNFFDNGDLGNYGRLGKALLVQFARFRFGVWEEHGYPGDSRFPYYWKPVTGNEWEVLHCTDAPISGEFKNIDDQSPCGTDPDDEDNLYPPPSECRFYPNASQVAKSSLMSYHYLPTFEAFCNATNHDRSKPTPQNYYCRYKSVMEVIQGTPDWKMVTKVNSPGRVNFNVVKISPRPLLYILLDSGLTQVPGTISKQISARLSTFIESREVRNTVAGVGKYPTENHAEGFTELATWRPVRNNTHEFVAAFHNAFDNDVGLKNYAQALKDLLLRFNKRKHSHGAVILVVKMSPEPNLRDITLEAEVLVPLLLSRVKVFAIEVQGSPMQPGNALERIVESSEGSHLTLRNISDFGPPLDEFFNKLTQTLQTNINISHKYVIAMDEMMASGAPVDVRSYSKITHFQVFATPLKGQFSTVRLLKGDSGNYDDITLSELTWDNSASLPDEKLNFYFSSEYHSDSPLDSLQWTSLSICGSCRARIVILLQVEDISLFPQDIEVRVATSAINGVVDFAIVNAGSEVGALFAIYAKLEQNGISFKSVPGLTVTAVISFERMSEVWSVELKDNGNASPDITTNDGIFSGAFIPKFNAAPTSFEGMYKIFVTVKYAKPPTSTMTPESSYDSRSSPSAGKLFPIDQRQIGCGYLGCSSIIPEKDFVVSSDIENSLEFVNLQQYVPVPTRIVDLVIIPLGNNIISLQWSAPSVVTFSDDNSGQADWYEIRHQDSFVNLLAEFQKAENISANIPPPALPGSRHNVTYDFGREADRYYAIRTISVATGVMVWSPISVIVGVNIRDNISTTTTTTTTTVKPTTSTTLPPRTTQPGPSTTPEEDITTIITTRRTTLKRSTTVKPTTPAKTTTMRTTTEFIPVTENPQKHWFKTTEGIITISVFGSALLILILVGGGLYIWLTKYR